VRLLAPRWPPTAPVGLRQPCPSSPSESAGRQTFRQLIAHLNRVLGIFQRVDRGFCRQAMTKRILPRLSFAFCGHGTHAQTRIAAIASIWRKELIRPPGQELASYRHFGSGLQRRLWGEEDHPSIMAGPSPSPAIVIDATACVLAQRVAAAGRGSIPGFVTTQLILAPWTHDGGGTHDGENSHIPVWASARCGSTLHHFNKPRVRAKV
jgi:hypothetical protein